MIIYMKQKQWEKKARMLVLLGGMCFLLRVLFWFIYKPVVFPDTSGYELLASQIRMLNFNGYEGIRTPGYPLFLLICALNHHIVWLVQSFLGIVISIMLFEITFYLTQKYSLSFLAGILYSFSLNLLFFEATVLTETLSIFLIVLSLLLIVKLCHTSTSRPITFYYVSIGVVLGFAILVRPYLLILVFPILGFLAYRSLSARLPSHLIIKYLSAFIVPVAVIVLGWCAFNKIATGYFGITTLTGYSLTQHSGAFIEFAPDRYSTVRDIYLEHREINIAEIGTHSQTIWRAYPEMLRVTGLSFGDLSRELTKMSMELFVTHPDYYLKSVFKSWVDFWRVANYWRLDNFRSATLKIVLDIAWIVQHRTFVLINFIFLVITIIYMYKVFAHKKIKNGFNLMVIGIVLPSSLFQAMVEHGENARYAIVFQPLIFLVVLVWLSENLAKILQFLLLKKE